MSRQFFSALLVLLFAGSVAFCAKTAEDPAQVRKAIDQANAKSLETWKKGDAAGFASVFAEDAVAMTLNHANVKGRQNIQDLRAHTLKSTKLVDGNITTQELEVSGDLAFEIGTFSYKIQAGTRPPQVLVGRYLAVWKRQSDGSWKIRAHAGLPDLPKQ